MNESGKQQPRVPNVSIGPNGKLIITTKHEYGFIVFVCSNPKEGESPWLSPMLQKARRLGCSLINFDRDAATHPDLPTWEW